MHTARLVIKDFWGFPSDGTSANRPKYGVSINVLAADNWKAARMRNRVTNLKKLRGIDYTSTGAELQRRGKSNKDVDALCLDYTNEYPASLNAIPSGVAFTPGLTLASNPFKRGSGLAFTDGTPGVVCELPGPEIEENYAHTLQFYLHKPPEEELAAQGKKAVFAYRWGMNAAGVEGFWQFQVLNGHASLMRLKPQKNDPATGKPDPNSGWTQVREDQLHTLLTIEDPTNVETAQIATLEKELYQNVERLNVGKGNIYNQAIEVTFIPERRGMVTVDEAERDADSLEVPDVLKKRQASIIWPKAVSRIYSTVGIFWLQFGRPKMKKDGDIRLGAYIAPAAIASGNVKIQIIKDEPPGTSVSIVNESGDPSHPNYNPALGGSAATGWEMETVIRLSGDGAKTPFVYAANLYYEAGQRSGINAAVWDSNDHPDCIKEIDPQLEGSSVGPISRKSQYRVTLRALALDPADGAFGSFDNLRHTAKRFENRVCDLYINGVKRVGNGIVAGLNFPNARSAAEYPAATNMQAGHALWGWTDLELDICDKWFIMDEDQFTGDEPVGDGEHMGQHLRSVLRGAGERVSEIAFTDEDGPVVESASLGEKFIAQPEFLERRGPYMQEFIRAHDTGRNQIGVDNNGLWRFGPYSTTPVIGRHGAPINFSSAVNDPSSYPGRYALLAKYEMTRDFAQVFNHWVAIGAEDENGKPIIRYWSDWTSIKASANVPRTNALGRRRVATASRNSRWRTRLQIDRALRRRALEESRSGWFLVAETYFHDDLYPGDQLFVEGWPAEIVRIPQGTWANDRMTIAFLLFD